MTTAELERLAEELGIDVVGAAPAEPYDDTERHIRERREQGLFADMRFTMARPEVSCHPETLLPGARTVISAALCYYADEPEPGPGEGRLPRYTWFHAYAELREKLDALGRALGGEYRVLVDENDHVDREAAARAGVGFYGKNTMLITRRHGSWVVLGTLVTEAEIETSPRLPLDCGSCTLCIEACPTGALDDPGDARLDSLPLVLEPGAGPDPRGVPSRARSAGLRLRHLPGRLPVEPRHREAQRAGEQPPEGAEPHVSLVEWLELSDDELRTRYERLYFPRKDPRYLRRNALVALGNSGDRELRPVAETYAAGEDPLLREHAEWALARLDEASARPLRRPG